MLADILGVITVISRNLYRVLLRRNILRFNYIGHRALPGLEPATHGLEDRDSWPSCGLTPEQLPKSRCDTNT